MNFKKGDKAIIKARKHGHEFKLKDKVTIIAVNEEDQDYEAKKGKVSWHVEDDELKRISKKHIDLPYDLVKKGKLYDALKDEYDKLEERYGESYAARLKVDAQRNELLAVLEDLSWTAAQRKARGGKFLQRELNNLEMINEAIKNNSK